MPAIVEVAEETCSKCLVHLESEALKCARCSCLLHLRCSDLPVYLLIRYKTSQSKYVCRAFVLAEGNSDSLKEAKENITKLMKLEEKAIKAAIDSANVDECR